MNHIEEAVASVAVVLAENRGLTEATDAIRDEAREYVDAAAPIRKCERARLQTVIEAVERWELWEPPPLSIPEWRREPDGEWVRIEDLLAVLGDVFNL